MASKFYKSFVFLWLVFTSCFFLQDVYGQQDTLVKNRKNSVKLNITNPMIFGTNCYIFGYERTIGNHQSFSFNIGRFELPKFININTDSIQGLSKGITNKGISVSGDYRFYLAKENKYNSPHGVYIGPYFSYNYFNREIGLTYTHNGSQADLNLDFTFKTASLGVQLGYQFVFWNRVTLDMILIGPGIARYNLAADLSTSLDPNQESELFTKINEALQEKIPGYSLVLNSGSFEKSGSTRTTSFGFRYLIMVGLRF
jgi:hypothetical protein